MATEKTSLLQKIILRPKEPKMYTECLINIPLLLDDEVDYCEELTYEQLLPYKDDVWWQTLRRTCMVLFWLIIFLMSASACLISFLEHQKTCPVSNIKLIINNSNKVIPNIITLVDTALNVTNIQHSPAAVLLP